MSPAPTARARPSRSCARSSRRRGSPCMSIPLRISCASTSGFGSAPSERGASFPTRSSPMRSANASASMPARPSPCSRSRRQPRFSSLHAIARTCCCSRSEWNAGVAIAALRTLGELELAAGAFEIGVAKADWPARMQRLAQGRLLALCPAGSELWLDGSHNADGARAAANALADLEERVSRPLVLVIGMLSTKDCESFLKNFTGLARRVVAVPIPRQEKSFPADVIADAARAVGIPAQSEGDLETALTAIAHFGLAPAPR